MTSNAQSLARLMAWLSPVFPTGGFAYSAGLESAAHDSHVIDEASLGRWLSHSITRGGVWNETVLLAAAHKRSATLSDLTALALAIAPTMERYHETCGQGAAFIDAASAWGEADIARETPLPVAVGALAAHHGLAESDTLIAFAQTTVSNQCQAAIRLSLIGQAGAARLMAKLEPTIVATSKQATGSTLDDLGGCAFMADILSARHETLEPRIFLS
ncbi:MAG: urease accessory UreF family protein [Pseudomonadota bacterium]